MTNAMTGHGTLLQKGDGATPTENFTTIAEVRDLGSLPLERDTPEATPLNSPGEWAEHVKGLKRGGQLTFDISFVPTDPTHNFATGLVADFDSGVTRNFKLVFPDGGSTTWTFSGIVNKCDVAAPVDDILTAAMGVQLTGVVGFA